LGDFLLADEECSISGAGFESHKNKQNFTLLSFFFFFFVCLLAGAGTISGPYYSPGNNDKKTKALV
jgi:hypothetical protein